MTSSCDSLHQVMSRIYDSHSDHVYQTKITGPGINLHRMLKTSGFHLEDVRFVDEAHEREKASV